MQTTYTTVDELKQALVTSISFSPVLAITDPILLRENGIDTLIYNALFAQQNEVSEYASSLIYELCTLALIYPSSMHGIYQGFAEGDLSGFTTPALNVRTISYDIARLIFRLMNREQIGAVVFELSRTEMVYTNQSPKEYAVAILAAALKEGYQGPVFLQGDHFQFNKQSFTTDKETETNELKALITKAIDAKFYNIDIDASTLVDLGEPELSEQQLLNAQMTAELSTTIRSLQPIDQTISIGAEIGHIGDKNSTPDELRAFMDLYQKSFNGVGISKVSVQTGSKHGGTLLPDGTLEDVVLDFSILKDISSLARETYHMGGAVQHGASTLPDADFDKFVQNNTLEVHLATGLQNIIYDNLPEALVAQLNEWVLAQKPQEPTTETDEQFIYKTRKKALGPFKQKLWDMNAEDKNKILEKLEQHLLIIFEKLQLFGTREKILPYTKK